MYDLNGKCKIKVRGYQLTHSVVQLDTVGSSSSVLGSTSAPSTWESQRSFLSGHFLGSSTHLWCGVHRTDCIHVCVQLWLYDVMLSSE